MRHLVYLMLFTLTLSCSDSSNSKTSHPLSEENVSDAELRKRVISFEKKEKDKKNDITSITLDKIEHDFGKILTNSTHNCEFKITNSGKKVLVIHQVNASCGCTTPEKPEKPILPGESDVIKVSFKPSVLQKNKTTKTITFIANTKEKIHELKIHGYIY